MFVSDAVTVTTAVPAFLVVKAPVEHVRRHAQHFPVGTDLRPGVFQDLQKLQTDGMAHDVPGAVQQILPDRLHEPVDARATNLHKVITFTEKPPVVMARQFIATGEFFWNAGIFVWRLSTLRKAYEAFLPNIAKSYFALTSSTPQADVDNVYALSESISVDFGIMEHAENVYVMEASFGWSDVESWDSLYGIARHDEHNNGVVMGKSLLYDVKNSIVHVPSNRTVVLQGLDGYIVAANEDTILVCRRDNEDCIVKYISDVELMNSRGEKPRQ